MKYYSYNDYHTDPSVDPYVATLSEEEVIAQYWPYWYGKMCEKFGKEHVDANYSVQECVNDWIIVNWAWESDNGENNEASE